MPGSTDGTDFSARSMIRSIASPGATSMILPGETLLIFEMVPALFAAVAANEAEKVAPENTLVDVQMIGAAGRIYISGRNSGIQRAKERIIKTLEAIEGRTQ